MEEEDYMPDYLVRLKNVCIDRNLWEKLEKYWKEQEDLDPYAEVSNIIEHIIREYLDKRK